MRDDEKRQIRSARELPGVPDDLVQLVLDKCIRLEPEALAVLVRGSHATGSAHKNSDLDLTVITALDPATPYRAWFEQASRGKPLPISLSAKSVESWLGKSLAPAEWALGFPAIDVAEYLWSSAGGREQLGEDPSAHRPPGPPCLEDFVNTAVKAQAVAAQGDSVALRLYARETSLLAPALLRKLNPEVVVRSHREAMLAARDLPVAPASYSEDFVTAAGLEPSEDARVSGATRHLALELLAFLRARDPDVDPQPEMSRYLSDGTLERYVGEAGA